MSNTNRTAKLTPAQIATLRAIYDTLDTNGEWTPARLRAWPTKSRHTVMEALWARGLLCVTRSVTEGFTSYNMVGITDAGYDALGIARETGAIGDRASLSWSDAQRLYR